MLEQLIMGLYLKLGVEAMDSPKTGTIAVSTGYDRREVCNPFGVIAFGTKLAIGKHIDFQVELSHESSIATHRDIGDNTIGLYLIVHMAK